MALRTVVLIGMLAFWIALHPATSSALAGYQGGSTSISIGPDHQSAALGEIVAYTVSVSHFDPQGGIQAAFSGGVSVLIPSGLTLVGLPSCTAGCGYPSVSVVGQESRIEVQVDIRGDERASMSFQVMVNSSATVGTSYQLSAYLLGGVNTAGGSETAFATLTVTGPAAGSGALDNRDVYLDVTPRLIRVAPGGSALYMILPVFWGDWRTDLPDYTVEVRLPSGVTLAAEAICGPKQSTIPEHVGCNVDIAEGRDGSTAITALPGFTAGESNGLYITLAFDPALTVDARLQLHAFLSVSGDLAPVQQGAIKGSKLSSWTPWR